MRPGFDPWVGKIPWRTEWQPTPVFLPGEFHGQRSLAGYSPWGCKESDTTWLHFIVYLIIFCRLNCFSKGETSLSGHAEICTTQLKKKKKPTTRLWFSYHGQTCSTVMEATSHLKHSRGILRNGGLLLLELLYRLRRGPGGGIQLVFSVEQRSGYQWWVLILLLGHVGTTHPETAHHPIRNCLLLYKDELYPPLNRCLAVL